MTEIYIDVLGTIVTTTEKAILFNPDDSREESWIPKSHCGKISARVIDELDKGDNITLHITEWIIEQKDW